MTPIAGLYLPPRPPIAPLIPAGHLNFKSTEMQARPPFQPLRRGPILAPAPSDISLKCLPNAQLELIRLLASLFEDLSRPTSASRSPRGLRPWHICPLSLMILAPVTCVGGVCGDFSSFLLRVFCYYVPLVAAQIKGSGRTRVRLLRALSAGEGAINVIILDLASYVTKVGCDEVEKFDWVHRLNMAWLCYNAFIRRNRCLYQWIFASPNGELEQISHKNNERSFKLTSTWHEKRRQKMRRQKKRRQKKRELSFPRVFHLRGILQICFSPYCVCWHQVHLD